MLLGKDRIIAGLKDGTLYCYPAERRIEPTHIDVTLGQFSWLPIEAGDVLDLADADPARWFKLFGPRNDYILVPPRTYALGHTEEFIGSTVAHIQPMFHTRSTAARWGLCMHLSAGWGDPNFHGRWTLEIYNPRAVPVEIPVGARVGCMSFFDVDGNSELYTGRYNVSPEAWRPEDMLPRRGNW